VTQPRLAAAHGRLPWIDAAALAGELLHHWRPVCQRIAVGGSLRRGTTDVKDVELIAISQGAALHELLDQWLAEGRVEKRLKSDGATIAWGKKFKALLYRGIPVDLFITTAPQWGLIYLIRTGPSTSSDSRWKGGANQMLVTNRRAGGLLPNPFTVKEGWIWRDETRLATPDELQVWKLLGLPAIAPYDRSIATYTHWRKQPRATLEALRDQQWHPVLATGAQARCWPAVGYPGCEQVFMPSGAYYVPYSSDMLIRLWQRRGESPMRGPGCVKVEVLDGVRV
jgi:hypothetical protein